MHTGSKVKRLHTEAPDWRAESPAGAHFRNTHWHKFTHCETTVGMNWEHIYPSNNRFMGTVQLWVFIYNLSRLESTWEFYLAVCGLPIEVGRNFRPKLHKFTFTIYGPVFSSSLFGHSTYAHSLRSKLLPRSIKKIIDFFWKQKS